jgi:hypothetical protein
MPQTVSSGPYAFFTLAQLEAERERYIAARQGSGSALSAASVNGQSLSFGATRQDWSLDEWGVYLQAAFAELAPGKYGEPPTDRSGVRFY